MNKTKDGKESYTVVQLQEALEERQTPDRRSGLNSGVKAGSAIDINGKPIDINMTIDRRKDERRSTKN